MPWVRIYDVIFEFFTVCIYSEHHLRSCKVLQVQNNPNDTYLISKNSKVFLKIFELYK